MPDAQFSPAVETSLVTSSQPKFALVIFASREPIAVLRKTVAAAVAASEGATVDIIVNGNPHLSREFNKIFLATAKPFGAANARLWNIDFGDKANAWNRYIDKVWSGEEVAFFMDGYAHVENNAVSTLRASVLTHAAVLAGTGVPSTGRTAAKLAATMKSEGGFHGNFCCIKGNALEEFRKRRIQLPTGLYRVDSLMGAFLSFGLDNTKYEWNSKRIFVEENATWSVPPKHWWAWRDVMAKLNQQVRQARGKAENEAVKYFLIKEKRRLEDLPDTVRLLIKSWMDADASGAAKFLKKYPLSKFAIDRTLPAGPSDVNLLTPQLVAQST